MPNQKTFKILITGAGGMLGSDLAAVLKDDFEVVGLDKRPVTHLTVPYDICDLTHARKTRDAIVSHQPNLVIHAAALTDVDYCEDHHEEAIEQNVGATKNVVDACNDVNAALIFYSTDYVFDGQKKGEYTEEDTPNPISFYGNTKLQAEQYILAQAKQAVIFRITWLFGVWGRCFPKAILRQAADAKKMTVVNDQVGRPTYSWDVAEAMKSVLLKKREFVFDQKPTIFHLGNMGTVNWADFARFILNESNLGSVKIEDISSTQLKRPAPRPLNSVLSLEKLKHELALELPSWQDATRLFLPRLKRELAAQDERSKAQAAEKENTAG
ncbi:MAG TPA: dTDP-4-dehydrorhamnose reductase [Candidatus Omnitrophota bacterium]|nr:dTDP-4-dehydrorhamnose reductase [Candidatus Omnitrophota bacterium]